MRATMVIGRLSAQGAPAHQDASSGALRFAEHTLRSNASAGWCAPLRGAHPTVGRISRNVGCACAPAKASRLVRSALRSTPYGDLHRQKRRVRLRTGEGIKVEMLRFAEHTLRSGTSAET